MIKAVVAGLDRVPALALEEVGKRLDVKIKAVNVYVPPNYFVQATDFGSAYICARLNTHAAMKEASHGNFFVGLQSMLRRRNGGWEHLIGIMIVSRHKALLCGTWTEPVGVPLVLVDELRSRGLTTNDLERVLADKYSQDAVDPYCRLSGGKSRQKMIVEALLRISDRRWLASR